MALNLELHEVIKSAYLSTKAYGLNQKYQQLTLEVHMHANKPMIKEALKKLFNVEAESIRTSIRKGKTKKSGRHIFSGSDQKKAIVTLKRGQSVDIGLETVGTPEVKGE